MAVNPIQKKSRNAFLIGVIVTLIICLLIGGSIFFLMTLKNKQEEEKRGKLVKAYALKTNIESGKEIKSGDLESVEVYENMVPANFIDSDSLAKMQAEAEDNPLVAKVNLYANTIITADMVSKSDEKITNDLRYIEYNMISLQTTVDVDEYIDIRLTLPNGQDYIVVSKAKVASIQGTTIGMNLTEEEILMMNSAMVEAYIMTASNFYAVQYVEPGNQKSAAVTYTPTGEVRDLITMDSNIVSDAKTTLEARFSDRARAYIDSQTALYSMEAIDNAESGFTQQIEDAKKAREEYLQSTIQPATTTTVQ